MKYINYLLLNVKGGGFLFNAFSLIATFFAPISYIICVMFFLIFMDLITKIWSLKKEKKDIRFSKLNRGNIEKTSAYLISILSIYAFQYFFIPGIDLTKYLIGIISAGELSSIFQNLFKITDNKLFLIFKNKMDEWIKNKLKKNGNVPTKRD